MMRYYFKRLDESEIVMIKELFVSVFTKEPWNDDWSDENQLELYLHDLVGQSNSLTFGLYEENELIAISMGHIRHWYSGTEYYIDELGVSTSKQGKGVGTLFLDEIERACKGLGFIYIFLLTENNVLAYEFYKKRRFHELKNNVAFVKEL